MLFSSIPFLYYFLPVFFIVYFIIPNRFKNSAVFLGSLFFYGCEEPKYLILMVISISIGYIGGIFIGTRTKKRLWLTVSVSLLIFLLGYFKYADFLIESFNTLTNAGFPALNIVLPIGISFYTFQIISYLVDVYRNDTIYQQNFIRFGTYVVLFPQLIAGPIVRYKDVAASLCCRAHTISGTYDGIARFLTGLGKKILLANSMAELCEIFRVSSEKSVLFYWMYALAFTLFIYFDFSGYSDMAIGLGKIMGFHFPENFNYPYLSSSITEFWRRWHMTLGTWFRDYVYIPLGGNRVKKPRWFFNVFIVWMFTGLWHGASWNFVIWGLGFAILLIFEKQTGFPEMLPKLISHTYLLAVISISFLIFNASDMTQAWHDIQGLFGFQNIPFSNAETLYYLKSYLLTFGMSVIGCTPLPKHLALTFEKRLPNLFSALKPLGLIFLLLVSTAYLVDGSFNPFLYFRF